MDDSLHRTGMPAGARSAQRPGCIHAGPDRRTFLRRTGGCLAQLALLDAAGWLGADLFAADPPSRVIQEVPWGRLERVADGVWAMVSTPLEDRRTLCNGGIVQGRDTTVLIEAFGSAEGSVWMAEQARRLTGRWPDHVIVTHYHGDHVGGLSAVPAMDEPMQPHMTAVTRDLARERAEAGGGADLLQALNHVTLLPPTEVTRLDLGGRVLQIVPNAGHTASDVTVELEDPSVVFCGDLVWHRYFPNFMDAIPSQLSTSVRALARDHATTYVPGHGPLAESQGLGLYRDLLDAIEAHARQEYARGRTVEEAAGTFELPPPLAEWYRFSAGYPARALGSWYQELSAEVG